MSTEFKFQSDPLVAQKMVHIINDAVGDKIKKDMHGLKTTNSKPTRFWDILNTDLINSFASVDLMTYDTHRGPWQMIMIYEKSSGYLYTFMRESRYAELYNQTNKRKNMHYLDILSRHLNADLIFPYHQETLFPNKFNDEDKLEKAVQSLIHNLQEDGAELKKHVLVLFESIEYDLTSVRAVMIDTSLNIVKSQDWSQYISAQESIISDNIISVNRPSDNPTRGLKLKSSAISRQESNLARKDKQDELQETK